MRTVWKRIRAKYISLLYGYGLYEYEAYKRTCQLLNSRNRKKLKKYMKLGRLKEELQLIENPHAEVYYLIRRDYSKIGLFSIVNTTIAHIAYAKKMGYIPVVDMQNYENAYLEKRLLGKENAWNYYFATNQKKLDEIYRADNIVLSNMDIPKNRPNDTMAFFNDVDGQREYWHSLALESIPLCEEIIDYAKKQWTSRKSNEDRVLGVLARGTDYYALKPSGHPVQPEIDQLKKDIECKLAEWNCNKIFLATEDSVILRELQAYFGAKLFTQNQEYVDYQGGATCDTEIKRNHDARIRGQEYVTNLLMLTWCNCIIAGRTSGSVGAVLMKGKWEQELFYDLGTY